MALDFLRAWRWKREGLSDELRYHRPYEYTFEDESSASIIQSEEDRHGLTVWDSSIVLSKYLELRAEDLVKNQCVLELGAGCGLCSIVAARCGAERVCATDVGKVVAVLDENMRQNCSQTSCKFDTQDYWWGNDQRPLGGPFDLVLAADCMYIDAAAEPLAQSLFTALKPHGVALVSYGRNCYSEEIFFRAARKLFDVEEVPRSEQHEAYNAEDVSLYCLTKKV